MKSQFPQPRRKSIFRRHDGLIAHQMPLELCCPSRVFWGSSRGTEMDGKQFGRREKLGSEVRRLPQTPSKSTESYSLHPTDHTRDPLNPLNRFIPSPLLRSRTREGCDTVHHVCPRRSAVFCAHFSSIGPAHSFPDQQRNSLPPLSNHSNKSRDRGLTTTEPLPAIMDQ